MSKLYETKRESEHNYILRKGKGDVHFSIAFYHEPFLIY